MDGMRSIAQNWGETLPHAFTDNIQKVSEWSGHVIRVIKDIPHQIQQNPKILVITTANALFFALTNKLLNDAQRSCEERYLNLQPSATEKVGMWVGSCAFLTVSALAFNKLLAKVAHYSLNNQASLAISATFIALHILFKQFKKEEPKADVPPQSKPNDETSQEGTKADSPTQEKPNVTTSQEKPKADSPKQEKSKAVVPPQEKPNVTTSQEKPKADVPPQEKPKVDASTQEKPNGNTPKEGPKADAQQEANDDLLDDGDVQDGPEVVTSKENELQAAASPQDKTDGETSQEEPKAETPKDSQQPASTPQEGPQAETSQQPTSAPQEGPQIDASKEAPKADAGQETTLKRVVNWVTNKLSTQPQPPASPEKEKSPAPAQAPANSETEASQEK